MKLCRRFGPLAFIVGESLDVCLLKDVNIAVFFLIFVISLQIRSLNSYFPSVGSNMEVLPATIKQPANPYRRIKGVTSAFISRL